MRIFLALIAIVVFAAACSSGESSESTADTTAKCKTKSLNPNGDSELAILMREMANWTDSCKVAIMENRSVMPAKPAGLSTLHTAKRTDETIDASLFNSMATLYEGQIKAFEGAAVADRAEYFNAMVSGCVGCHQNFCQGPLTRINKMIITGL